MKNNTIFAVIAVIAIFALGLFLMRGMTQSPSDEMQASQINKADENKEDNSEIEGQNSIVDIAAGNENFSILVEAVTQAGLVETLSGEGPFTVFAPTNQAFAKLPQGTLEALLADKEALTGILTYHVVSGKVMSGDVVSLSSAETVQGQELRILVENGKVFINDSEIVQADIEASNGVVHVIDSVLLPE